MEKSCWEEFAETGKVTDYLKYRGVYSVCAPVRHLTEQMDCETAEERCADLLENICNKGKTDE